MPASAVSDRRKTIIGRKSRGRSPVPFLPDEPVAQRKEQFGRRLIKANSGILDHLALFDRVRFDPGGKLLRPASDDLRAGAQELGLHVGPGEEAGRLAIEASDDVAGVPAGAKNPVAPPAS